MSEPGGGARHPVSTVTLLAPLSDQAGSILVIVDER